MLFTYHLAFGFGAVLWPLAFPLTNWFCADRVTCGITAVNLTCWRTADCLAFGTMCCRTLVLRANDQAVRLIACLLAEAWRVHLWASRLTEGRRAKRFALLLTDGISAHPPTFWCASRHVSS